MAWTKYHVFLVLTMVITGSINSLSTKWADKLMSIGSDGTLRYFNHPFLQTATMFLGEIICLLVFKIIYWKTRNTGGNSITTGAQNFCPLIMLPASVFDLLGTSIMYIGLNLTYVSSFQMFRGSIILFVAALSSEFSHRYAIKRQWLGIFVVMLGLLIVGATDAFFETPGETIGKNSRITGDLLIILAQIASACQMVYEENFITGRDIPAMQAIGWEGVFGFLILSCLIVVFNWIPAPPHFINNPRGTLEDPIDGFIQIWNNPLLLTAVLGTIVSIAFFNFAGLTVTQEMSATTRMVIDSLRTLLIWLVSIGIQWQSFRWLHLVGFGTLIFGMAIYDGIVPLCRHEPEAFLDIGTDPLDTSDFP